MTKFEELSFGELRKMIPSITSSRMPTPGRLRNEDVLVQFMGATVYKNGYFVFEEGRDRTVFTLDNFRFVPSIADKKYYKPDELNNMHWYIAVYLLGNSRIESNKSDWLERHTDYYFDDVTQRQNEAPSFSFEEALIAKDAEDEQINLLHEAIKTLSPREQDVINCKLAGINTHVEIATFLGISRQRVDRLLKSSFKKIQKFFADRGCINT